MATLDLSEVRAEPLSALVLRTLREAIVEGRLAPGEAIVEVHLSRQLGVSRAPLREALRQLEEEGLVVSVPFRGTVVSTIDRRSLDELCSLRNLIERFAVQRVIERATDEDLTRLQTIVDSMERHAELGDIDAVDQDDIAFHATLLELADHTLLLQVWSTYAAQIRRAMRLRNRLNRDPARIVALHRPILDALWNRDLAAAAACLADHGTDLVETLISNE
jgi:DNA-binding GntR family transcriptional regulator